MEGRCRRANGDGGRLQIEKLKEWARDVDRGESSRSEMLQESTNVR
jgi:hypothetical protein